MFEFVIIFFCLGVAFKFRDINKKLDLLQSKLDLVDIKLAEIHADQMMQQYGDIDTEFTTIN